MRPQLPDPVAQAKARAAALRNNHDAIDMQLDRMLIDAPQMSRQQLLDGVLAFHQERMAAVPPKATYPEAAPWVDHEITFQKTLKDEAGLSDQQLAQLLSLGEYMRFRAFKQGAKPVVETVEKCRVAYIPDSDRGQLHIKNVDDPASSWRPEPEVNGMPVNFDKLVWDGTGSGMHIDDEPAEIFPLDVRAMLSALDIQDVPAAVEFLTRYGKFWSSANCVLHDGKKRSVAIEKCTRNHMAIHHPGPDGRSWCSGMACRDKNSPIAKYQASKRKEYLDLFNLPYDGPDAKFWAKADAMEIMLSNLVKSQPSPARSQEVIDLFLKPVSDGGLNKDGSKSHPAQGHAPYTLATRIYLPDEKTYIRYVRDKNMNRPSTPETFTF